METWDAITSRRNVREFADRPLSEDERFALDEAAPRTPHWPQWHLEWRASWRTPA